MFLNPDELVTLTGKERYSAQLRALRLMGIEHRQRPDGSVAVLRAHVEQLLGGRVPLSLRDKTVPDFSMVK